MTRGAVFLFIVLLSLSLRAGASPLTVVFDGLTTEQLQNVLASVDIAAKSGREISRGELTRLHALAPEQIRRALEPFGFYNVTVDPELLAPEESSYPGWLTRFSVVPGKPVRIADIEFTVIGHGSTDGTLSQALVELPLNSGDVFDHQTYEHTKRWLTDRAIALGYLDVSLSRHRVEVDADALTAMVTLELTSGPLYRFGTITFQQSLFTEAHMARYRLITPGERYSRTAIAQQRALLSTSGHFSDVTVSPGTADDSVEPKVPITVSLTAQKPNRLRGQLGWGTETGVGARADWTRRHIGSLGHYFNLGGTAVQERTRIAGDFRYFIPLNPLTDEMVEIGIRHESKNLNFEDVDLEEGGETRIATSLASVFWNPAPTQLGGFDAQWSAGINFTDETYDVFEVLFGNLDGETQDLLREILGEDAFNTLAPNFRAVIPEIRLSLQHADDPLFIRRGDFIGLRVLGSSEDVGANISFWQARLSQWSIFPVGDNGRLLLRSAMGYSEAESRSVLGVTFNQMPEFYEFRAGGARNIRGYAFESLFPEDGITGGKHQLTASVEYEHHLFDSLSGAVFLDGGDAFNAWDQFDENYGVGVGIRWRSPFGPARLDLGVPLNDADEAFQIYVTVGPEF